LSIGFRRNRLLALVAAGMLIACSAVYSAHALADRSHQYSHCDVCVHFGGCAGSPATRREIILPTRSPVGHHLPRGPPPILA